MSSGEADAIRVAVTNSSYNDYTVPSTTYTWPVTYTWSYSNYVYLYQITCPRCGAMNWAQVDTVVSCKGLNKSKAQCKAKLKAVLDTVDYEIPVTRS